MASEDLDMRRREEEEEDHEMDLDDPNVKRRGRGFNIRGQADMQVDGVRAKNFDRLDDESESGEKAARSIEGWIILVTHIHEEATEEDLLDKFADYGDVKNCHMNLDRRTGYNKGYALLEFESLEDAKSAIEACKNGLTLMEERLGADFAFVKPPGPSGVGTQIRGRGARDGRDTRARSPGRR